ncbi:hypothetical protein H4R34_004390 [Dimargaris verticillata]|uniref:Uncharacterized protein n=1 Tax=Dimargaris verticillata TaxID=2761393 RepID=A0A9W8EB74_9FUNG|nr:hypothetical protein H4R34_004390 [Dimargaris verticillata]
MASRPVAFFSGLIVAATAYYAVTTDTLDKLQQSQDRLQAATAHLQREMGASSVQPVRASLTDVLAPTLADRVPQWLSLLREEKQRWATQVLPQAKSSWNAQLQSLADRANGIHIDVANWQWGTDSTPTNSGKRDE